MPVTLTSERVLAKLGVKSNPPGLTVCHSWLSYLGSAYTKEGKLTVYCICRSLSCHLGMNIYSYIRLSIPGLPGNIYRCRNMCLLWNIKERLYLVEWFVFNTTLLLKSVDYSELRLYRNKLSVLIEFIISSNSQQNCSRQLFNHQGKNV